MHRSAEAPQPDADARNLACGLDRFPIALGLAELTGPRAVRDGTGAAILASRRPVAMVRGRVAGDFADLAVLDPALRPGNPHRAGRAAGFAPVAAITAPDLCVALQGDETNGRAWLR